STIGERLHHAGLHAHRPLPRLYLKHHVTVTKTAVVSYQTVMEWNRVIFSDESRFKSLVETAQRTWCGGTCGQHQDEQFCPSPSEACVPPRSTLPRTIARTVASSAAMSGGALRGHQTTERTIYKPWAGPSACAALLLLARHRYASTRSFCPGALPNVGFREAASLVLVRVHRRGQRAGVCGAKARGHSRPQAPQCAGTLAGHGAKQAAEQGGMTEAGRGREIQMVHVCFIATSAVVLIAPSHC
ncbi:hypothetical protein NFI96_013032, partial [Prochilodus magdalenae]